MNAKKLIAGGMTAFMLAGTVFGMATPTSAAAVQQNLALDKTQTVHTNTEFYLVDSFSDTLSFKNAQTKSSYNLSDSVWSDNGSDYYFSLLDTAEKKLYLNLKQQADNYLTGMDCFQMTEVVRNNETVQVCILPLVSYEGLTTEQMKKVFYCFLFENPQYYILRNSVIYSENTNMMTIGLYDLFSDGTARADYTRQFAEQLEIWDAQIQELTTTVEKEQYIHKIVCEYVAYNENMAVNDPNDKQMSQSCISAILFDHTTVCAGYAQMFSLLCNRAGIPCVTVTSAGHAWNKVRLGNVWYNTDCTWDDCRGDDTFLNVTDEALLAADTQNHEHNLSPEWEGVAPLCTTVFELTSANEIVPKSSIAIPERMSDPVVSNSETGKLTVSYPPLKGCDGYTVQYASNGAMLPANKKDVEITTSCDITGLKNGKDYYIRVRAYVLDHNGTKLYGTFSKKVKIQVL